MTVSDSQGVGEHILRDKLLASGIHLSISTAIFVVLSYLILFHWYPQPFFLSDGGWQGIRIIAGVDLVLGPVLTFVVFRKNKPSLKFDLGLIALFQISALIWGIWAVYNERPVVAAFAEDAFFTIPSYQLEEAGMNDEQLPRLDANTPAMVFVEVPMDPDARMELFSRSFASGKPLHFNTELFRPLTQQNLNRIQAHSIDMLAYLSDKPGARALFDAFIEQHETEHQRLAYLPLRARYGKYIAVFDTASGRFVDVLNIRPPEDATFSVRMSPNS